MQTQLVSQRLASVQSPRQPVGTRAGIGVTGVDQHGTDTLACGQVLTAQLHRCCAKAVLREDTGHRGAFVDQHHAQVLALGLADAGFGDPDAHTGNGKQLSGIGG